MIHVLTEGDVSAGYRIVTAAYHDSIGRALTPARPKHCRYDCTLLYSRVGVYCILLYCARAINFCLCRNLPRHWHISRIKLQTHLTTTKQQTTNQRKKTYHKTSKTTSTEQKTTPTSSTKQKKTKKTPPPHNKQNRTNIKCQTSQLKKPATKNRTIKPQTLNQTHKQSRKYNKKKASQQHQSKRKTCRRRTRCFPALPP